MTPEASRHRRRIGGLLAAGKLPWDYTPEPTPMELPLCVLCRRPNPTPASSACPTCIPPDEGEIRAQGRVAELEAERDRLREALCWAVGFIRCNFPKAREQYEDMRNAESLAEAHPLHTGEFQRASARAELAEAERDRTASELHAVHAACMEHVRIRNEMGEEAAELRQALTRLACFAATAKHASTFEWMLDLVEHLNRTAVTLNEPTQFTHRKNQATGEMWIIAEAIP